jgi:hypothetical protein
MITAKKDNRERLDRNTPHGSLQQPSTEQE